jgi:hypothetical protein
VAVRHKIQKSCRDNGQQSAVTILAWSLWQNAWNKGVEGKGQPAGVGDLVSCELSYPTLGIRGEGCRHDSLAVGTIRSCRIREDLVVTVPTGLLEEVLFRRIS